MKEKGFALIVLVVLLALIGIGAAYYLGSQQSKSKDNISISTSSPVANNTNPTVRPTNIPNTDWQTTKSTLSKLSAEYLKALFAEERSAAFVYLADSVKADVDSNWPQGYGQFKTFEILNEFRSDNEEKDFYSQDQITFTVKLYKENDSEGNIVKLMFIKENGSWKTLSWYLLP